MGGNVEILQKLDYWHCITDILSTYIFWEKSSNRAHNFGKLPIISFYVKSTHAVPDLKMYVFDELGLSYFYLALLT